MTKKKSRSLIPRSIKLIPAAAISAIVLAVLSLLGLLNFNPPSVSDANSSEEAAESESADESTGPALVSTEVLDPSTSSAGEAGASEVADESSSETTPTPLQPIDLVDVLIDGDSYRFAIGQRDEELIRELRTVAEIVDACAETSGDASGIKIRITRTFQATAQAEKTLMTALKEAGLSDDEIDQRRTLVSP